MDRPPRTASIVRGDSHVILLNQAGPIPPLNSNLCSALATVLTLALDIVWIRSQPQRQMFVSRDASSRLPVLNSTNPAVAHQRLENWTIWRIGYEFDQQNVYLVPLERIGFALEEDVFVYSGQSPEFRIYLLKSSLDSFAVFHEANSASVVGEL